MKHSFSLRRLGRDLFFDLLGSLLIAAGIYNFALEANFPLTGISGICLILSIASK